MSSSLCTPRVQLQNWEGILLPLPFMDKAILGPQMARAACQQDNVSFVWVQSDSQVHGERGQIVCVFWTLLDLAVLKGQAVRRRRPGLSGEQQLFKLKCRAATAGEIPPDYITIERQIPLEALLRGEMPQWR